MANTSFKAENGLSVTGNAQFDYTSKFNANVTIEADQFYIGGNLYVTGTQVFIGGNAAVADILAGASGLKIGNTTNQFDAYLSNVFVYGLLNPVGNTILLGNSTNRWVISGNTLNISTTSTLTGAATLANTIAVTGAATLANTLGVTGATTLSNTMSVTGAANALSTFGVGGAANALSTLGVNGATTLASTLSVAGAANALSTFGVRGVATFANTTAYIGAATFSNTLAVTGTTTLTGNATLSGALQTISGNAAFNSSTLFVDATNNRVGIGTTGPATTLTVQGTFNANGAATLSNTSAHTGSATFANTIAVTGATTLSNTLAVTGTTTFNNDVTINANLTVTGTRTYVNTQTLDISDNIITLNADLPGASPPTENAGIEVNRGSSANSRLQWNETTDTWQITADGTNFFNILSEGTTNTNFDSGTLFIDALNNRVGINNTAPGVALRVTGAADISSTANIQGNANIGGTLGIAGLTTAAAGLAVTGTANVSSNLNIGTFGTTNGVNIQNTAIVVGNTSANATHQWNAFIAANASSQSTLAPTYLLSLTVNASANLNVGTFGTTNGVNIQNTVIIVGNTTSNALISGNLVSVSNTANLTSTTLTIGTTTVTTALINTAALNVVNQTNTSTLFVTTSANVGTALTISATALTVAPNANFDSGTLFVDAVNNRVGINNTAPGVALRVTGAADISSTANIQGNANIGGTLGIAGLTTAAAGLAVTGTANVSAQFNVGGGVATTNGATITNTQIIVGNSFVNAIISPSGILIRTNATGNAYSLLSLASTDQVGGSITLQHGNTTSNSTIVLGAQAGNNASIELGGSTAAFIDFKAPNEDDFDTRLQSSSAGFSIIAGSSTSANVLNITNANVNIDAGTLFVDAVNNRVGINNTAPGVALRVTGAADISSTANIQGNANVGGTLGVTGAANALSTLGVNGLLTACSGLIVTGTANVSTNLNVSGTGNVQSTFGMAGAANALSTLGVNGLLFAATNANVAGQTNTATLFVTTSANVGTALTVNSSVINAAANLSMAAYTEKMTALAITTNGTTDLNLQTSSVFRVTVANTVVTSANVRFINPPATGTAVSATLILQYLGTGANSIGALAIQGNTSGGAAGTIKYAYDSAPTLTLTPAKSDILSAITYDGGATYIIAPSFMNFTT